MLVTKQLTVTMDIRSMEKKYYGSQWLLSTVCLMVTIKFAAAIDFHSMEKILQKSMATVNCLITNILQNIFFCAQYKKETHSGLEQVEDANDDNIFNFRQVINRFKRSPFPVCADLHTYTIWTSWAVELSSLILMEKLLFLII